MSEINYNIGDEVRIRNNLRITDTWHGVIMLTEKLAYCGVETTITACSGERYRISADDGMYNWTAEMFDNDFRDKSFDIEIADIENLFYE